MSQAIYRKWRPQRFSDVIGQEHVTQTLQSAITSGRIGHAYLFCGPRGTGKTTTARLLAKAVNCKNEDPAERPDNTCSICQAIAEGRFLDLIEIDAASNTGVDDIRTLRERINFAPSEGKYKVYIIDEVHMLSTAAFNALLKTLEEPPPHAIFVLATTEEHKVLATIKSRCQQFNFRLLSVPEIINRLNWLATQENLDVEPEALALIANEGAGSLRDAESLLDQLITGPDVKITLERTQQVLGTASTKAIIELVETLLQADAQKGLGIIHEALATGADARQFCRQMVAYLRSLVLLKSAGAALQLNIPNEQKNVMLDQAKRANQRSLIDMLKRFNEGALAQGSNWQPQLPLELAFIESLPMTAAPSPTVAYTPVETPVAVAPPPPTQATKPKTQPKPAKPKPPPEKPNEAASAAPSPPIEEKGGQTVTIDRVSAEWRTLLQKARQRDKALPALISMCKPVGVESSEIIIGFDYPILREKFDNTREGAANVASILSEIFKTPLTVRTVIASEYKPPKAITRAELEALARELGGVVRETNQQE